jgi:hypothetical protein
VRVILFPRADANSATDFPERVHIKAGGLGRGHSRCLVKMLARSHTQSGLEHVYEIQDCRAATPFFFLVNEDGRIGVQGDYTRWVVKTKNCLGMSKVLGVATVDATAAHKQGHVVLEVNIIGADRHSIIGQLHLDWTVAPGNNFGPNAQPSAPPEVTAENGSDGENKDDRRDDVSMDDEEEKHPTSSSSGSSRRRSTAGSSSRPGRDESPSVSSGPRSNIPHIPLSALNFTKLVLLGSPGLGKKRVPQLYERVRNFCSSPYMYCFLFSRWCECVCSPGKSLIGSVVTRKNFESKFSATSVTEKMQEEMIEEEGRTLRVADGPGLLDIIQERTARNKIENEKALKGENNVLAFFFGTSIAGRVQEADIASFKVSSSQTLYLLFASAVSLPSCVFLVSSLHFACCIIFPRSLGSRSSVPPESPVIASSCSTNGE